MPPTHSAQSRDRLDLSKNLGSALVRDSKNEGGVLITRGLLLAEGEHRRAGCIGDGISISQVLIAISQGMKRKRVQWPVGHEDQMLRAETCAHGRDKFPVEGFQMIPGGT